MSVDISKAYLEIQKLRKEIRKAELDIMISFGSPPNRSLHCSYMNASGLPTTNSQMLTLKRSQN
ncbi:hypothetical protein V1279_001259 [Bradyrhizobium sp. AZCC 1610]